MGHVQFAMSHQGVQGTIARLWLNLLPKVKCWRVAGSFPPSKGCWNSSPNVKLSKFFGKDNWWKLWLKRDPKVRLPDCMVGRPNQAMLLHPKQKTQNVLSKHEHWKEHVAMHWMMLVWILGVNWSPFLLWILVDCHIWDVFVEIQGYIPKWIKHGIKWLDCEPTNAPSG